MSDRASIWWISKKKDFKLKKKKKSPSLLWSVHGILELLSKNFVSVGRALYFIGA